MAWIIVFALVAVVSAAYCLRFEQDMGENVHVLLSNDRQGNGILWAFCWLGFVVVFRLYEHDYNGIGWVILWASVVAFYFVGQALTLVSIRRKIRIEAARGEVMAARFHRTEKPAAKPAFEGEKAAPAAADSPAFSFDPARFGK